MNQIHPFFQPLLVILVTSIFSVAHGQPAPASLPFPGPLSFLGTYYDTDDDSPGENSLLRRYTLTSATGITDVPSGDSSTGTYSYSRTGSDTGQVVINVSASDGEGNSETSQITYLLKFTTVSSGTCTFSGNYSGVDEDGSYSESVYGGTGTFYLDLVPQTLEEWRLENFGTEEATGDAANNFDFDNDGIPNLVEYALGTSPKDPSSAAPPISDLTTTGGDQYLSLSITKPQGVTGVTYRVEVSSSLTGGWSSAEDSVVIITDDTNTLTVRDKTPVSPGQPQRFIRLRVDENYD